MGKLYIAQVFAGVLLLLASRAGAAIPTGHVTRSADGRSRQVADLALPKAAPAGHALFSSTMLDPARCNYEYVEMYGTMVVRTELKLTCTTSR